MKKFLILLLVFGLASAASAAVNIVEDFQAYTVGSINGQGGWTGSDTPQVADEGGNKFWRYTGAPGDKRVSRPLPAFDDDVWTLKFDMRASQKGGNGADEWATNTPSQLQIFDQSTDPIHFKFNQNGGFMMNDGNPGGMMMNDVPDAYTAGMTPAVEADFYMNYVGQWAHYKVEVDMEGTSDLYWMDNSGNWDLVGSRDTKGDYSSIIDTLDLAAYLPIEGLTLDFDNVSFTPEPATIMLLGLGGLALIRRKRC